MGVWSTKSVRNSLRTTPQVEDSRAMPMDHESLAGTQEDFSLIDLFEMVIELHADRVAVVCGSDTITYGNLNRAADAMAQRLRSMGIESTSIVAIYLDRSIPMVVALLAVLKAGGAYVPIDPTQPAGRAGTLLADLRQPILLTQESLLARRKGEAVPEGGTISIQCADYTSNAGTSFYDGGVTATLIDSDNGAAPSASRPVRKSHALPTAIKERAS